MDKMSVKNGSVLIFCFENYFITIWYLVFSNNSFFCKPIFYIKLKLYVANQQSISYHLNPLSRLTTLKSDSLARGTGKKSLSPPPVDIWSGSAQSAAKKRSLFYAISFFCSTYPPSPSNNRNDRIEQVQ